MTERLRIGSHILDRPVRPRGRCNTPIGGRCVCFRPRDHDPGHACHCAIYGGGDPGEHGAVAVPAGVAGALVTEAPWGFNGSPWRKRWDRRR